MDLSDGRVYIVHDSPLDYSDQESFFRGLFFGDGQQEKVGGVVFEFVGHTTIVAERI